MAWRRVLLLILGLLLTLIGLNEPMTLIFPMWIFTYLAKDRLKRVLHPLPLWAAFIGAGVVFGLLTELFAIADNLARPPDERILLSPDPALDILYGVVYYLFVILTWYLLLRRMRYTKRDVFLLTGLYGIAVEETGQVFLRIFAVPIFGPIYALIILCVYGIFPMLAYLLTEHRFSAPRAHILKRYAFAAVALFIQYALYGLYVLPAMKALTGG